MRKTKFKKKIGTPPGTLIYTGDRTEDFEISVIDYDADKYKEFEEKEIEKCFPFKYSSTVTWLNIS